MLKQWKNERVYTTSGVIELQEKRRNAVTENLPRLAFATSDIVIYISNESFVNAAYMKRVKKLAFDSTESIDSAYSPALILVYNKSDLFQEFDPVLCTNTFLASEENEEISRFYSEVVCICIPDFNHAKKIKSPTSNDYILFDGEEIYNHQISKLNVCSSFFKLVSYLLSLVFILSISFHLFSLFPAICNFLQF